MQHPIPPSFISARLFPDGPRPVLCVGRMRRLELIISEFVLRERFMFWVFGWTREVDTVSEYRGREVEVLPSPIW